METAVKNMKDHAAQSVEEEEEEEEETEGGGGGGGGGRRGGGGFTLVNRMGMKTNRFAVPGRRIECVVAVMSQKSDLLDRMDAAAGSADACSRLESGTFLRRRPGSFSADSRANAPLSRTVAFF